jgi:hypothetical protein
MQVVIINVYHLKLRHRTGPVCKVTSDWFTAKCFYSDVIAPGGCLEHPKQGSAGDWGGRLG